MSGGDHYMRVKLGHEAYRLMQRLDKRLDRATARIRRLGPDAGLRIGSVEHPGDCACYDCLWGEVADLRRRAKNRVAGRHHDDDGGEPDFARTGRLAWRTGRVARGSAMRGVRSE